MTIIKQENGSYLVDVRPQGRNGKRIRKKFPTKHEALRFEKYILATEHNKAWLEKPTNRQPLRELIDLWWKHHGQTLKSGRGNYLKLLNLAAALGEPRADQVTKALFAHYRTQQLEKGNKPATINRTHQLLSGVFTVLIKNGVYHAPHPLKNLPKLKSRAPEMAFLSQEEIALLLTLLQAENDTLNVVRLCLATGARWSEAAGLTREHVIRYKVTFNNTKNGGHRTVPISEALYHAITRSEGRLLFPTANYALVRQHLKDIVPDLPDGQAVHVLRHTFASHFMMEGGNILTLQKILGHSTITQTMTYAHFSPDYLQDAVRFNPLKDHALT